MSGARATCGTCPMWRRYEEGEDAGDDDVETDDDGAGINGQCRAHPPRLKAIRIQATWPNTHEDDWCAAHPRFRDFGPPSDHQEGRGP